MTAQQVVDMNHLNRYRSERQNIDYAIHSVISDLCSRYKMKKILMIGDYLKTIKKSLKIIEPIILEELEFEIDHSKSNDFDGVIALRPIDFFSEPSAFIEAVSLKIQVGGLLVTAIPYYGYFELLSMSWYRWWSLMGFIGLDKESLRYWSKECAVNSLEANGFKITESIGVRDGSLQWKNLILVARKIK